MPNPTDELLEQLSDEELIRRMRGGSPQVFGTLLRRYLPLIRSYAGRYATALESREDLVQEGSIALMDAAASFDPQRGVRFATYASRCIARGVQKAVLRNTTAKRRSVEGFLPLDALEELQEQGESPDDEVISRESIALLQEKIATLLSGFEQEAFQLYLSGCSYQEMANTLHTSTKAVDNALQRIRRKLRNAL